MTESTASQTPTSGNLLLDIANAFVAIHKEFYGRGPTKARAHVGRDLVVVLLQGGYSRAEQTLHAHGRDDAIHESRLAMQATMEDTAVITIERLTGRKVYSFMSANEPNREMQAEVFVLEPEDSPAEPEQAGLAARAQAARDENRQVREDLRALRAEQAQSRAALQQNRRTD
ncbi:MAG TPA: Na-translocating system protein MpsC family protein [Thermoleophilaceae bacterium]